MKNFLNLRNVAMIACLAVTTFFASCDKDNNDPTDTGTEQEANIVSFTFTGIDGTATIDKTARTVTAKAKETVDLTAIKAVFTLSLNATATVNGTAQVSEQTVNNFTNPVTYHVTSGDSKTTNNWTVTITKADGEPGLGGNPVLNLCEIWKDDTSPTVGMLFINGDVYYYYLNNGTWGNREKVGTWDGENTITAVFSADPNTTFTVSGNKLYEYRKTDNALMTTYTKITEQVISGQSGGCGDGKDFVGTWTKPFIVGTATLVFNSDNTFSLTNPTTMTYNGTYTVSESTATLTGTGAGGANATGTATISGDNLELSVAMVSLNGTYTKLN